MRVTVGYHRIPASPSVPGPTILGFLCHTWVIGSNNAANSIPFRYMPKGKAGFMKNRLPPATKTLPSSVSEWPAHTALSKTVVPSTTTPGNGMSTGAITGTAVSSAGNEVSQAGTTSSLKL